MSIFGNIITADELENAVEATLRLWFRTYLNEIELQKGVPDFGLVNPRSVVRHVELIDFPEEQLPRLMIVSPGMAKPPLMEGDGTYRGFWRIGISLINSARDRDSTNRNSKWYAGAIRAIILQHRSLGGFADGVSWEDENYMDGPVEADRTLALCTNEFIVEVEGIVDRKSGPAVPEPPDPDDLPGSEWPLVENTDLDVEVRDLDDEIEGG
jgi:hypothetical protein